MNRNQKRQQFSNQKPKKSLSRRLFYRVLATVLALILFAGAILIALLPGFLRGF